MTVLHKPLFRGASRKAGTVRTWLRGALLACGTLFHALACAQSQPPLTFGVLPLGGMIETREDWKPLLDDMGKALGRPLASLSVTSYEGLATAMQENRVDIAFASGKLAVDAVIQHDMTVLAQVTRPDGLPGYRAVLISRREGPVRNLDDMLSQPGRWRLAHGETSSMSGYIIPQLQLFGPRNLLIESHFRSEMVAGHTNAELAVANGEVDVGTSNTADLERFARRFPAEFSQIQIIWMSDLIPHGAILMRKNLPAPLLDKAREFLRTYGRTEGTKGDAERAALTQLHGLAGFLLADDSALVPVAQLDYQLARSQILGGRWVTESARQAKLSHVTTEYEEQRHLLDK
jgi:phosphonate transport system substrate-binding protein